MRQLKVCYFMQTYPSFLRTALQYRRLLGKRYLLTSVADADVVVLHGDFTCIQSWLERFPSLSAKYLIGYCVWETSDLPVAARRALLAMREVWTCSEYCRAIFSKYHSSVKVIPHIIERDTAFSDQDLATIKNLVTYDANQSYFLSIGRIGDVRKNLHFLIEQFEDCVNSMPGAKLIVKDFPSDTNVKFKSKSVIYLPIIVSDSQMNALYHLSCAYVSAHHSEGWGLTLSDAMLLRRPVIATGYSGNVDFMNDNNSFLVNYQERFISAEDCSGLFSQDMKWAYPADDSLKNNLRSLYLSHSSLSTLVKVEQATSDIRAFCSSSVANLIYVELDNQLGSNQASRAEDRTLPPLLFRSIAAPP